MVPRLNYPLLPDPAHAAGERDAYHFRLLVPPVASVFQLPGSYKKSFFFLLFLSTSHIWAFIAHPNRSISDIAGAAWIDGISFFILFGMAYLRTHRWSTFEITADRFRLYLRVFESETLKLDFPRSDILEIRLNRSNGKLILRVHRQEMREIFISVDRIAAGRVVDQLREVMTASFEPLPNASDALIQRSYPPATASQRRFAMTAVTVVMIAVIGFWWLWPTAAMILLVTACIASIPMGIIFGTQKKDFFP